MADNISAIPQQPQLGRLAQFLRFLETQNAPEFLPKQLDVMGLMAKLALPQASTVENLSYGNYPFAMPPAGTGAAIPQVKTGRKPEVADLVGMIGGVPGVGAVSDVATKLSNEAADAIVRAITRNPEATATGVIRETSMPFMQAVAPRATSAITPEVNLQMAREAAEKMGLSTNEQTRMLQLGYEPNWYHGTTGDVEKFRLDLLGEATGAESAKKGFFFARDPIDPPSGSIVEPGSGARTASGYSLIGGDREYREAMRKASIAEKNRNWDEYEKQMQIAEDFAISRLNKSQELVAKYGEARDTMIDSVQKAFYNKKLTQQEAEALDEKFRSLMPYGWYNLYNKEQFDVLKNQLKEIAPESLANQASKSIDDFIKVRNEKTLDEKTQSGSNVIPAALKYKNPLVYDFKGSAYREQTYADLVNEAKAKGHDAVILKNTYDPGAGKAELVDVGVVFEPSQIRSRFAAFDPTRTKEGSIVAGMVPVGLLGDEGE